MKNFYIFEYLFLKEIRILEDTKNVLDNLKMTINHKFSMVAQSTVNFNIINSNSLNAFNVQTMFLLPEEVTKCMKNIENLLISYETNYSNKESLKNELENKINECLSIIELQKKHISDSVAEFRQG